MLPHSLTSHSLSVLILWRFRSCGCAISTLDRIMTLSSQSIPLMPKFSIQCLHYVVSWLEHTSPGLVQHLPLTHLWVPSGWGSPKAWFWPWLCQVPGGTDWRPDVFGWHPQHSVSWPQPSSRTHRHLLWDWEEGEGEEKKKEEEEKRWRKR